MNSLALYGALNKMREHTALGIPFDFSYLSYNGSLKSSEGIKSINKAQLRSSYRQDQSNKSNILIGYIDGSGKNRWFYLPLLLTFNNIKIKHE